MKTVSVSVGKNKCPVIVARDLNGLSKKIKEFKPTRLGVITNKKVAGFHLKLLISELEKTGLSTDIFYIPDGEEFKSLATAGCLYGRLLESRFDRHSALIAFGGGVAGDICGFIASTYMRGIKFFQLPTTLLAQVDAAIGGKTAVNLPCAKNAVGTFYQPGFVWSNVKFLDTLPRKEWINGMAEVVKYGVIMEKRFFKFLKDDFNMVSKKPAELEKVIFESSKCKALVVSNDERETAGLREILNFGHTFGHILEVYYGYKNISHGEAVSLGMVFASKLAQRLELFCSVRELTDTLKKYNLPVVLPRPLKGTAWSKVLYSDKKFIGGVSRFVLPVEIGRVKIVEGIKPEILKAVVNEMNSEIKGICL